LDHGISLPVSILRVIYSFYATPSGITSEAMVWDHIPKEEARQMAAVWAIEDARKRKSRTESETPTDPPLGSPAPVYQKRPPWQDAVGYIDLGHGSEVIEFRAQYRAGKWWSQGSDEPMRSTTHAHLKKDPSVILWDKRPKKPNHELPTELHKQLLEIFGPVKVSEGQQPRTWVFFDNEDDPTIGGRMRKTSNPMNGDWYRLHVSFNVPCPWGTAKKQAGNLKLLWSESRGFEGSVRETGDALPSPLIFKDCNRCGNKTRIVGNMCPACFRSQSMP
jgi:hypothetical protein